MQTTTDKNIIKRSRYYHSEMDGYQIRKGTPISRLGKNIVIFICAYDPFGKNASIYSVKSMCKEHAEINYDDGMETIFINIYGDRDGVDCNLKNVLEYFKTGEGNDDYTKTLEDAVNRQNSDEDWRQRHMTFEMKLEQRYEQGFDDGIQQGRESIICELYSKGLISKSDATASLSISDEDFDILVKKQYEGK